MFEPKGNRIVLQNAIQPPRDYELHSLVGTTYTLDLAALLSLPLSLVSPGSPAQQDPDDDTDVETFHALWEKMDRIYVFCEKGRIKAPDTASDLYTYIEDHIIEVPAPDSGSFHPKLWIAKYTASDQPAWYRILCLSRNLTFDRSLDVAFKLDGTLTDREYAFADQHPLGDFWDTLPDLVPDGVPADLDDRLREMAWEIRRVNFELPENVEDVKFHPIIEGDTSFPFPDSYSDIAVISPFLSDSVLQRIQSKSRDSTLVSRINELEQVNSATLESWDDVYGLDPVATPEPEEVSDDLELTDERSVANQEQLTDLHAKLFVLDQGWDTSLFLGSANATNAAFHHNVEFMTELRGKKYSLGTKALFPNKDEKSDDRPSGKPQEFMDLLVPFEPDDKEHDPADQKLGDRLEEYRETILDTNWSGAVESSEEELYLSLSASTPLSFNGDVEVACWPVSLGNSRERISAGEAVDLTFGPVEKQSLTQFFAFEIVITRGKQTKRTSFVLKLPVKNMPSDRKQALVQSVLSDPNRLLRLMSLLLDGRQQLVHEDGDIALSEGESRRSSGLDGGVPLVELLVQTLEREPNRIDQIQRLLRDLPNSDTTEASLPDDLELILETVFEARRRVEADD